MTVTHMAASSASTGALSMIFNQCRKSMRRRATADAWTRERSPAGDDVRAIRDELVEDDDEEEESPETDS